MGDDCRYFDRRASEERQAASAATNLNARQTHLSMAEAYERRARALAAKERRSAIEIVSGT